MVSTRVRDMAAASALTGGEKFYADDGSSNVYVTADQIASFAGGGFWVNIKTEYGAVGDGVTDDSAAFGAVSDDYQGRDLYLYLPPGQYLIEDSFAAVNGEFLSGMSKLHIWGYGASWLAYGFTGEADSDLIWWGGGGEFAFAEIPDSDPYDAYNAYIEDTELGDDEITLITPADAANFAVDDWVIVCALSIEGGGFEPHNCHYFEYRKIIEIAGAVFTLDQGLTDGPYLSTNPRFGTSRVTGAGPARIIKLKSDWDCEIVVRGLSFPQPTGPDDDGPNRIGANSRVMRFIDCDFSPGGAANFVLPSTQVELSFINCKFATRVYNDVEIDKNIEELNFVGCNLNSLLFQSSTIKRLRIDDCTVRGLFGTPRTVYATNSQFDGVSLGPRGYGATLSATFDNCQMSAPDDLQSWAVGGTLVGNFTFTDGTLARTDGDAVPWAIPGTIMMISRNSAPGFRWPIQGFKVLGVRTNVSNDTLVDTTMTQEQWDEAEGNNWRVIPHPCPQLVMNNCRIRQEDGVFRGSRDYQGVGGAVPMWSRVFRRFCTPAEVTEADANEYFTTFYPPLHCRGYLLELTIDVIKPYTGVETDLFFECSNTDGHNISFDIDTKVAGKRIFNPDQRRGFTANDSISLDDDWFEDKLAISLSADISGENFDTWPIIEVSVICDQKIAGKGGIASPLPATEILEWTAAGNINPDDFVDVDILTINKDTPEATTIFLPPAADREDARSLRVVDGNNDANTFNITLDGDSSETVGGAGSYVINTNSGTVEIATLPDDSGWYIVGKSV